MTGRRIVAGAVAALLLPASATLLTTTAHSAGDTVSQAGVSSEPLARKAKKAKAKKVTISDVLPPVVHQGRKPAGSNAAKGMVSVQVQPKKKNQKVVVRLSTGGGWKKAGQARTDAKGRALVAVKSAPGKVVQYRASVGNKTSKVVSNERFSTPTFVDEFSGRSLSGAWTHRVQDYNPEGSRTCSRGNPKAVQVKGGTVRLSVMKDPARKDKCVAKRNGKSQGKFAYRINGHISTEQTFRFRYGYAAARIKFPKQRGQHGSFWMQPFAPDARSLHPKESGAEIDIIEYFGDGAAKGGLTSFTYHWANNNRRVKTGSWIKNSDSFLAGKKDGWSKNYHVFSMKWTPNSYTMYIDGKESWRSNKGVSGSQQFPILSLLSSDYEINQLKGGDKSLPVHMNVDWIKVWETPVG